MVAAGLSIYACWAYSERAGLTRRDLEPAVSKAIRRRIVTAQALYALGAVIGYFDPVSYTHLDVYKRQHGLRGGESGGS